MKVKEIIIRALKYAGREDAAAVLESGQTPEGEQADAVRALLYCFNAVEDELARYYFPLVCTEDLSNITGEFRFEYFLNKPVKILSVQAGGSDVKYTLFPTYLKAEKKNITVTYEYAPSAKTLDGNSSFSDGQSSVKLLAAGAASEYALINGDTSTAEMWEDVYRREIDKVRHRGLCAVKFPPRRWV